MLEYQSKYLSGITPYGKIGKAIIMDNRPATLYQRQLKETMNAPAKTHQIAGLDTIARKEKGGDGKVETSDKRYVVQLLGDRGKRKRDKNRKEDSDREPDESHEEVSSLEEEPRGLTKRRERENDTFERDIRFREQKIQNLLKETEKQERIINREQGYLDQESQRSYLDKLKEAAMRPKLPKNLFSGNNASSQFKKPKPGAFKESKNRMETYRTKIGEAEREREKITNKIDKLSESLERKRGLRKKKGAARAVTYNPRYKNPSERTSDTESRPKKTPEKKGLRDPDAIRKVIDLSLMSFKRFMDLFKEILKDDKDTHKEASIIYSKHRVALIQTGMRRITYEDVLRSIYDNALENHYVLVITEGGGVYFRKREQ